jgi:hypothetical protein
MRAFAIAGLLALSVLLLPSRADALTLREVIELSRAGLGDEVLLALIEIDQRIFPIDPDTLRSLKEAGVSERVILAIVKSGRTASQVADAPPVALEPLPPPPEAQLSYPEPQVVYVERERPIVREVAVPVAVYIPVPVRVHDRAHRDSRDIDERRTPAEPVYWGWGGKLRPDAWKPSPDTNDERRRRRN